MHRNSFPVKGSSSSDRTDPPSVALSLIEAVCSVSLFVCLSINLFDELCNCLFVCLSINLFDELCTCLFICLFACLFVCLQIYYKQDWNQVPTESRKIVPNHPNPPNP